MAIPSQTATRRARSTRWALTPPGSPSLAPSPVYRPRRPTETPLYPVVQHHLETFLAESEQPEDRGVPSWVEHDFRRYLTCGILAHGFARLRCDACGQERLLAFSCKGRGVCPSCTTRRMAEVAAHLTDHVIPPVPARLCVLSLPNGYGPTSPTTRSSSDASSPSCSASFVGLSEKPPPTLRPTPPSAPSPSCIASAPASIRTSTCTSSSSTASSPARPRVASPYHRARGLDADAARALTPLVQDRVLRLFVRRRLLHPHEAADMRTWRGTGGFSLDGSVRVEAHDRAGLERLIRYCARPPQTKAVLAIAGSFATTLAYLAVRFEGRFGLAAVAATAHDILATLAFISFLDLEVSLVTVAGVLTVLGYSPNDTIVIFDRVRENLRGSSGRSLRQVLNDSINQTLPRTVLTTATTLGAALLLATLAGPVIRPLGLVMTFGILVGTLSSIFVASPVLLWLDGRRQTS